VSTPSTRASSRSKGNGAGRKPVRKGWRRFFSWKRILLTLLGFKAAGVMGAASLLGVALTAAGSLIGIACPPMMWTVLGFTLLAVGVLMLLLAVWCLALLLAGPRIRPIESGGTVVAGQTVRR